MSMTYRQGHLEFVHQGLTRKLPPLTVFFCNESVGSTDSATVTFIEAWSDDELGISEEEVLCIEALLDKASFQSLLDFVARGGKGLKASARFHPTSTDVSGYTAIWDTAVRGTSEQPIEAESVALQW
jgi:hypothetical protein